MEALTRHAGDLRAFARYARELPAFLGDPLTPQQAERTLTGALARRAEAFTDMLGRAVYGQPGSPYRRLLDHAGVELGDIAALAREHGVEGALHRLHDAGVFLTTDEFKGRRPVERPGLPPFTIAPEDLDNPLLTSGYEGRTGGSRGKPRRLRFELGLIAHEAAHLGVFLHAAGLAGRTQALWRPVPPGIAGLNDVLRNARLGLTMARWFTQYPVSLRPRFARHAALVGATRSVARRSALPVPRPEHVPLSDAPRIARWIAERRAQGAAILFNTTSSAGVRVASAALEHGHDIEGTVFRLGGEPFTRAREATLARAGARGICHYTMGEAGRIGVACAAPAARDDVHLLLDKLGVIQREREVTGGRTVGALVYTTLLPLSPKVMLNVESDDYGVLEDRPCGCAIGDLGLTLHLRDIRSYDKLNSEGMTFLGSDLIALVEEVLPGRFGGAPSDWQLVEEETRDGLTRVTVVASPRIGPVDEAAVAEAVLDTLAMRADYLAMMTTLWRDGRTIAVRRAEPVATGSAKVLPLHVTGAPAPVTSPPAPSPRA